jgi:aspartyl-tRNA(Asn)/glutamyl-tRNA(Gln) amidotransferase subunit B
VQETRHWDEEGGRTLPGRSKEEAHDYRYFPEPDLVPVAPTDEMRAHVRATMPELPSARRARYVEEWGIREEDARILVDVPGLGSYAEKVVAALNGGGTAKDAVNWVRQEVLAYLNESGGSPAELTPEMLAELVGLFASGAISRLQAKDVLDESLREQKWPRDIVEAKKMSQISDERVIAQAIDDVLAANPGFVEEYRAADDKAKKKKLGFVIGPVRAALEGKANMQVLTRLLNERLSS